MLVGLGLHVISLPGEWVQRRRMLLDLPAAGGEGLALVTGLVLGSTGRGCWCGCGGIRAGTDNLSVSAGALRTISALAVHPP
jgi:hypothetical protein